MSAIDYAELSITLGSVLLIDVRNRDELKKLGQLPGAHCLPLGEVGAALKMNEKNFKKEYAFNKPACVGLPCAQQPVLYCSSGVRARQAAAMMKKCGIEARVYGGSFIDWTAEGGTVEDGKPYRPSERFPMPPTMIC